MDSDAVSSQLSLILDIRSAPLLSRALSFTFHTDLFAPWTWVEIGARDAVKPANVMSICSRRDTSGFQSFETASEVDGSSRSKAADGIGRSKRIRGTQPEASKDGGGKCLPKGGEKSVGVKSVRTTKMEGK